MFKELLANLPMTYEYCTDEDISLLRHFDEYLEEKKENTNMNFNFNSMFDGMFKPIAPGMCKVAMDGRIAIKTPSGFKTFDPNTNKLTNCSNFAFDADGMFFSIPTFSVQKGDIILINGTPRCVINTYPDAVEAFSYADSTIDKFPIEHHVFMGKSYCYAKIFTPFQNMVKGDNLSQFMSMMMMSKMFSGNGSNSGFDPMMMMFMMNGGSGFNFAGMFDGMTNLFNPTTDKEDK